MSKQMTYVPPPADNVYTRYNFVKRGRPMSTISSIAMLNKLNVKDVGAPEERVVQLGLQEGLKLLKASSESKTVLTDVFLGMKSAA
ncbi:uncharacterized protein Pyn_28383 [Prunus yedoensis var. nudiflora]|uniref:Uncharacterized protein n=1 Tax=Prunus yedoensis var. nudiflora TaxID=2094558 RepID=A0A314Y3X3_PRUYE|nr:uncharacterized protein Pyn_28383 [Prunus yedoensis var. nudiflora]